MRSTSKPSNASWSFVIATLGVVESAAAIVVVVATGFLAGTHGGGQPTQLSETDMKRRPPVAKKN